MLLSFLAWTTSTPPQQLQIESKMAGRGGKAAQPSASAPLLVLSLLGLVLLSCFTSSSAAAAAAATSSDNVSASSAAQKTKTKTKTWCVAKPSASNDILLLNLNYACSQVSCAVIQKGGPCYYPDSLVSRAAVAMNLYYAANGRHAWNCYFNNSALVVQSDPSYGSCTYY